MFFGSLQVERGSPKSCFLFLGSVLCRVNWVSVLSDAWSPSPLPETQSMVVCLLFMMVLLAKEAQLVDETVSLGSGSFGFLVCLFPSGVSTCFPISAYELHLPLLTFLHGPPSSSK